MIELGVNIDHVATVREARKTNEPDPVWAAALAEIGGADGITAHLREDRRHICDRDIRILRETVKAKLNMEMACSSDVVRVALEVVPDQATIVPEKRQEITTEGGLDLFANYDKIKKTVGELQEKGIIVSLFLDPEEKQIEKAVELGVNAVELHTGAYSLASDAVSREAELKKLVNAGALIIAQGMRLHAGHGLTYHNVLPVAGIQGMLELNIGHSIIARALAVGLSTAVREMKDLINHF